MFDDGLPEPGQLAAADARGLVAALAGWAQVEAAATARRLAVIAEITARRLTTRKHTRAHNRRQHIKAERALNKAPPC